MADGPPFNCQCGAMQLRGSSGTFAGVTHRRDGPCDGIGPPFNSDEEAHAFDDACDDPECEQHGSGTESLYVDEPPIDSVERVLRAAETWRDHPSQWEQRRVNDELAAAVDAYREDMARG